MANWFSQYVGERDIMGLSSWEDAARAGHSPRKIAEAADKNKTGYKIGNKLKDLVWDLNEGYRSKDRVKDVEDERDTARGERDTARGERDTARGARDTFKDERDQYLGERDTARGALKTAEGERDTFSDQLNIYKKDLAEYSKKYTVSDVDYQTVVDARDTALADATDWQGRFTSSQEDHASAKALADAYREEAVARQLGGLQSGRTASGDQFRSAGLAGGRGAVSRSATDREDAVQIEKKVSAEDSVLSRKGPVVSLIRGGSGRTPSQSAGLASGGSRARYYAGRFG